MHHTDPAAGMSPRAHRHALRKQQLAMACCLALAFPLAAQAQQAEAAPAEQSVETLDTVRVTGIRADNTRPEPLDALPVPEALEIPVRLRVGGTGPLRLGFLSNGFGAHPTGLLTVALLEALRAEACSSVRSARAGVSARPRAKPASSCVQSCAGVSRPARARSRFW